MWLEKNEQTLSPEELLTDATWKDLSILQDNVVSAWTLSEDKENTNQFPTLQGIAKQFAEKTDSINILIQMIYNGMGNDFQNYLKSKSFDMSDNNIGANDMYIFSSVLAQNGVWLLASPNNTYFLALGCVDNSIVPSNYLSSTFSNKFWLSLEKSTVSFFRYTEMIKEPKEMNFSFLWVTTADPQCSSFLVHLNCLPEQDTHTISNEVWDVVLKNKLKPAPGKIYKTNLPWTLNNLSYR